MNDESKIMDWNMVCFTQQRKRMSRTLVLEDSISLSKDMNTHGSFRTAIRPNMIKKKNDEFISECLSKMGTALRLNFSK